MTSPAGLAGAQYRGAGWTPQGYAPAQQAYRYTAPLAQPAYAYTQHTTTVSSNIKLTDILLNNSYNRLLFDSFPSSID